MPCAPSCGLCNPPLPALSLLCSTDTLLFCKDWFFYDSPGRVLPTQWPCKALVLLPVILLIMGASSVFFIFAGRQ